MQQQPGPLKQSRGFLFANIAVLFFGLAGVLGRLSALPAPLITLGRVVFAGLVLLLAAAMQRVTLRPRRRRDALLLIGQGVLLALHWVSFFQSINVSSVAIGLLSFSSFPLFTAALEPLLLRQRPGWLQVCAALLILPGVYLLVPAFSLQNSTTVGVLWGLLSGATFALLSVANRWLGRSYPSLVISLYQDGIAALVLLPALLIAPDARLWTLHSLLILLALGLVCTALAHTLFIASMRNITAQSASLLASLEPVWGIVFGMLLLHDIPTLRTILGGAIILCATLLPGVALLFVPRRASAGNTGIG
ncbi:MAG: DMT family transporter [Ktedonobacteraceae bacterium]|nr:DMT family transporter [Ktedonobacteraceae bacterium]